MTPRERTVLKRYLRKTADAMGLRDWTFEVRWDTEDDDSGASVETTYGRRTATVYFRADFRDETPEFQRMAVAHELIHVAHHGAWWHILKTLPDLLGSTTYSTWEAAYRQFDELATDTLASAIAPHFPLIKWPK
jgi:hypothetical protein